MEELGEGLGEELGEELREGLGRSETAIDMGGLCEDTFGGSRRQGCLI